MRFFIMISITACLLALSPTSPALVRAQAGDVDPRKVDILALTCRQFEEFEDEETPLILAWLDGWTAARTGRETIPPEWLGDLAVLVRGYCARHPDEPVYKALEPVQ